MVTVVLFCRLRGDIYPNHIQKIRRRKMGDLIRREDAERHMIYLLKLFNIADDIAKEVVEYESSKIESAGKEQVWTPCTRTEGLPTERGLYLCTMNYGARVILLYTGTGWNYGIPNDNDYVVAWMTLPEEYKTDGAEL